MNDLSIIVYFLPLLLSSLWIYFGIKSNSFLYLCYILVFCFGFLTGSDWRNYELLYNDASFSGLYTYDKEIGFYIVMLFCKSLGLSFWVFHILFKVGCFLIFVKFLDVFKVNKPFALMLFFPIQGLFLFVNCPFRNLIAVSISLIAFIYLIQNRKRLFVLFTCISSLIHISSLFISFMYFYRSLFQVKNRYYILYLLISIVFALNPDLTKELVIFLISKIPFLDDRLSFYIDTIEIGNVFSLGSLFQIFVFYLLVVHKQFFAKNNYFQFIWVGSIFYLILSKFSTVFDIAFRVCLFLSPIYVLGICTLITTASRVVFNSIKFNSLKLLFLVFVYLQLYAGAISHYAYLPYSNYLYYILSDNYMSFQDRANYNIQIWNLKHNSRETWSN